MCKQNELKLTLQVANMYPNAVGKQVQRRVMIGNEHSEFQVLGVLYDNTECEEHRDRYVFHQCGGSRIDGRYFVISGEDNADYLNRAVGLQGHDLMPVLESVRTWAEAVQEWIRERRSELRAVLDKLPQPAWALTQLGKQHIGLTCQILGPHGSFTQNLSWANMAKLLGNDFEACEEFQITDAGTNGEDWGSQWFSYEYEPSIVYWGTYSKQAYMAVDVLPEDTNVSSGDEFDNSTSHLSEEAAR